MLKPHHSCKVCNEVKKDKKLLNQLFETTAYLPNSKTTLLSLYKSGYQDRFSYRALLTHTKKHQFLSQEDFDNKQLQKIVNKSHQEIARRKIESVDVFDTVIDLGMEQLQAGEMRLDSKDLLSAAKMKKEFALKEKDQELSMAAMMWHFASGENNESRNYDRRVVEGQAGTDFDATAEVTNDSGAGKGRSSDLYHTITWDALTQGSDTVSEGNSTEQK